MRPDDRRGRLEKDNRVLGRIDAKFGRMIDVIQPDADQLADIAHRRAEARIALHKRKALGVDRWQIAKHRARQIRQHARQVAQIARAIHHGGLFLSRRTASYKFHSSTSPFAFAPP